MTERSAHPKDARDRPQTPHDFTLLRTIRYEDAIDGVPPLPRSSINSSKPPSSAGSLEQPNGTHALSTPSHSSLIPPFLTEVKRDSGIATAPSPAPSTVGQTLLADGKQDTSTTDAAEESGVPSITVRVQDEAAGATEGTKSATRREESENKPKISESTGNSNGILRIENTQGIPPVTSRDSLSGVDLADLASEKLAFSPRGSLLVGGKKMNERLQPQLEDATPDSGLAEAASNGDAEAVNDGDAAGTGETQKQGLVAGRRKPSVHMLQAALNGGRVLSAEEMTFSMRVRSMYEHGDEHAADLISNGKGGPLVMQSLESVATERSAVAPSVDENGLDKTKQTLVDEHRDLRSMTPNTQASYSRQSNELAGGIEDWENLEGQDVDRYGFINPKRNSSRNSTADQPPAGGIQRVATALRIESGKPRRNRSSQLFTPSTNRVASIHSSHTERSTANRPPRNPFRSKDRRILTEASDMLTLPPGFADSSEQEEAGEAASMVKQRERKREDKWQSMARVDSQRMRSVGKGGGMRFEFDTSDQKLINRTWKGIPDRWRATAWHSFLSTSAKKRNIGIPDDELVLRFHKLQEESSADDVQIDMDVPRTINLHIMFRRRYRGGQRLLFRVLHAISLYFPDTGYVQGMASLAATLLCYFEEERAFVMMVRLWQLRGLEQFFQSGFGGLMKALEEFEKDWLRGGDVSKKLEEHGITSTTYGTRWYLTLFNMSIPFHAQLRVWDVFMLLGDSSSQEHDSFGGADLDVLHATSAALVDATREIILDSDFENAMKVLTSFVPVKDEDLFMRVARAEWKMRKKRAAKT